MLYLADSGVNDAVIKCVSHFSPNNDPTDRVGHGTSMAYIIKSVAPTSEIISVKLGDQNPNLHDTLRCLEFIDKTAISGVLLFNANFKATENVNDLEDFLDHLAKKLTLIVPAGNNADSIENYSPARCNFAYTIGSLNKSRKLTSVSNFDGNSKKVDLYAISTSIPSLNANGQPIKVFGTSVAAAIVAALIDSQETNDKDIIKALVESYNDKLAFNQ